MFFIQVYHMPVSSFLHSVLSAHNNFLKFAQDKKKVGFPSSWLNSKEKQKKKGEEWKAMCAELIKGSHELLCPHSEVVSSKAAHFWKLQRLRFWALFIYAAFQHIHIFSCTIYSFSDPLERDYLRLLLAIAGISTQWPRWSLSLKFL